MGFVLELQQYLDQVGRQLDNATPADLESFVALIEAEPGSSGKLHLWGLIYYYEFLDDPVMVHVATTMRRDRVELRPFRLRQFRGVDTSAIDALARVGIRSATRLLEVAADSHQRAGLASRTGISPVTLDELVRLSDLARISGLKGIRARLYLDAGVGSVADLATRDPADLLATLKDFVDASSFDGTVPSDGEVRHAVAQARRLDPLVEW